MIFNPDIYKDYKSNSKKDRETAADLRLRRDYLNTKMIPLKRKWANDYMVYKRVTKEAMYHRFTAESDRPGKQYADGNQEAPRTGEDREGKYICSPLVQQKVDLIKEEYCARTFDCNVKSIARQDHNYLIQFLQDEVFKSSSFQKAHHSAFEDALVKGTGFLRTKLYDISVEDEELVWSSDKKGKRSFKKKVHKIPTRKGLTAEYVDLENILIDPTANDPQECFICSHLDIYEAQRLFPHLKDKFYDPFSMRFGSEKDRTSYIKEKGMIAPEVLPYYKVGEFFVNAYKHPDIYSNFAKKSTNSMSQYVDESEDPVAHLNGGHNNDQWFSNVTGYDNFSNLWGQYYFGDKFNHLNSLIYNDRYLLTEYYFWGGKSRYIVMIGDYVLYDGPMMEPFRELPLTPVYFKHKEGGGIFGKSLNEDIYDSLLELNEAETKNKVAINIASAVFMGVDESQIEDSEGPIEVKPFTTIGFRNNFDTEKAMRPIEQIGIQNPGVELQGHQINKFKAEIESIYPNLSSISNQLPKEEVEKIFYSRDLKVNLILTTNANQLSEFAHKVFLNKLKELEYFQGEGKPYVLPPSDHQPRRQRAIFVKQSNEEIRNVFMQVQELLAAQYEEEVMMAAQQLQQDPETQQEIKQIQENGKMMLQEAIKVKANSEGGIDEQMMVQLEEAVKEDIVKRAEQHLMQKAQQMVPQPEDENLYISYDDIRQIRGNVDIDFKFNKTKQEIQRDIQEYVNFVNSNQLSQISVNMNALARQFAIAHDINPSVVMPEALDPLQTLQSINTRSHIYYDSAKNPGFFDQFNDMYYNIKGSTLDDMKQIEAMRTEEIIKRESAKISKEGQANILQDSYQKNLETMNPQAQQGGSPEGGAEQ